MISDASKDDITNELSFLKNEFGGAIQNGHKK
jgi:hypothetical protein